MSAVMSLVWLNISKALEKSITMISLRGGTRGVETPGYILCERKEDGNAGVVGTEAVLDG